jgi:hypothetical protein
VVGQVDNHNSAHILVVVHTQPMEELADQCETSAEEGALTLLVEVQTSHHACPFQPCAESANKISCICHNHANNKMINQLWVISNILTCMHAHTLQTKRNISLVHYKVNNQ